MSAVFVPDYMDRIGLYTTPLFPHAIKAVLHSCERARSCVLTDGVHEWKELHNVVEPFDFRIHVFLIPREEFPGAGQVTLRFCNWHKRNSKFFTELWEKGETALTFEGIAVRPEEDLLPEKDSHITETSREVRRVCDGVTVIAAEGVDRDGAPMHWFFLEADPGKTTFAAGTPDDGYEVGNKIQTVEGQALAARAHGKNVVAATNSDFFDMFGDCVPSGPCVKDGRTICQNDPTRPFFGVTDEGKNVIASYVTNPELKGHMEQAVAGMQRLLKDGNVYEVNPAEPFCGDRHPRTAVGIRPDGTVLILITDGRLTPWSQGTTLYDTALLLKNEGATEALNLDGGGSSTLLTGDGGKFNILNRPVDAREPGVILVREIFDTLQVIAK